MLFWLAQPTAGEYTRLLNSASQLIRENRLDAAIRELTRAAAMEPRSAMAHLLLGQAYLGKGTAELVAQAKAEFQQSKELDSGQALPSFYIAKIDLDLGRISQAERELQQALEKRPGEHYLLALLGEVRRQQGRIEEAIELTTKAIATGPEALPVHYYRALAWWDRKDEIRALEDLQRVLDSPFPTVDAFLAAGAIHLHHNRLAQAEASFRKAVELGPDRAEPRLRLAQVMRRQRRFDLALKELSRVESAPHLSSHYFQKLLADAACEEGLIRLDQGDPARAKASFQRALEIDPSHQEAMSRLRP